MKKIWLIGGFILLVIIGGGFVAVSPSIMMDGDSLTVIEEIQYQTNPLQADTDNDGLDDDTEIKHGTDPTKIDSDRDSLTDLKEIEQTKTDPTDRDTDGDGINDGREYRSRQLDPLDKDTDGDGLNDGEELEHNANPSKSDTDGDNLTDPEEIQFNTHPNKEDTDRDGLTDSEEVKEYGTDPNVKDTDEDGLRDGREVSEYGTDPTKADTDNDGLEDNVEIFAEGFTLQGRTDPTDPDTDNDGIDDGPEIYEYNTNPLIPDSDSDGLKDGTEIDIDTNPRDPDTDGDGLFDGTEVRAYGTDPLSSDTDNDGYLDGSRTEIRSYSSKSDLDDDGIPDWKEVDSNAYPGADPGKMDVFVELDYFEGEKPPQKTVEKVEKAYAEAPISNPDSSKGIRIHILVGDEIPAEDYTEKTMTLNSMSTKYMPEYFNNNSKSYHYGVVVYDALQSEGERIAGIAATNRDYGQFLIENPTLDMSTSRADLTAVILMHELGHSLGIPEDAPGVDSYAYSYSEYPSVMNYNGNYSDPLDYSSEEPFDGWGHIESHLYTP